MKNPQEKAKELVLQFSDIGLIVSSEAEQCALIAVDEIIDFTINNCCEHQNRKFWQEVKQEILKL